MSDIKQSPINIPESPIIDHNGQLAQEWLILFNQLVRKVNELDKASKAQP